MIARDRYSYPLDYLREEFSAGEMEHKTRNLYAAFSSKDDDFFSAFSDQFYMDYRLLFGQAPVSSVMYYFLSCFYRNEYFVKQRFLQAVLNRDNVVSEFPVLDCRADILDLNGSCSACYEIKTKYDNLSRLEHQVDTYSKVFQYINIVCSEDKLGSIRESVPNFCGIYYYKDRSNCKFTCIRNAEVSPNIDGLSVLCCFRKIEKKRIFGTYDDSRILSDFDSVSLSRKLSESLRLRFSK